MSKTFASGYTDGWQSVMGKGLLPSIPAHTIPGGKTPYEAGYEKGVRVANERKFYEERPTLPEQKTQDNDAPVYHAFDDNGAWQGMGTKEAIKKRGFEPDNVVHWCPSAWLKDGWRDK